MSRFPGLDEAMQGVDAYYKKRGIFQGEFGFGKKPAIVVVDFCLRRDLISDAYAGESRLLDSARSRIRPACSNSPAGMPRPSPSFTRPALTAPRPAINPSNRRPIFRRNFANWDERACQIDTRVAPAARDLVLEKENASAFFGTHLIGYLVQHGVDTLLITGCSTSACIQATAVDAKSYRLKPIILRDCVGDRAEANHEWTLFDIQARFADVVPLETALDYLEKR